LKGCRRFTRATACRNIRTFISPSKIGNRRYVTIVRKNTPPGT
jgi:hypothetical protein